jgi:tRNA(fMet)-specific endonuclease VapC
VILFLLDTNAMIALLNGRSWPLAEKVHTHPVEEIAISSIVAFELYFGAFNGDQRETTLAAVDKIHFQILPFEQGDARRAGEIRALLRRRGTPIGPFDLLIAAQALTRNLTLVTNNLREFQRVPDLRVEDWTTI